MILFISVTLIFNVILLSFFSLVSLFLLLLQHVDLRLGQQRRRENMEPIRTEHCNCSASSSVRSAYVSRVTACSTTRW